MAYIYGDITNCKVANGQTRTEYECRLGWDYAINSNQAESQDIVNNQTKVKLVLEARSISSTYRTEGTGQTTTIDNTVVTSNARIDMSNTNVWQVLGTKEMWISHNADGTLSIEKIGSFTCTAGSSSYSLRSGSASVVVAPTTIPRASQPSLSADSVDFGKNITIYTNRVSTNFTHYLYYSVNGGQEYDVAPEVSYIYDNYTWTIPNDLMNNIPNSLSTKIRLRLVTYSGNTAIGSKTIDFTATVPNSVVPSISSVSISEGNFEVGLGEYVQGKSMLNVAINASGSYSSYITAYNITGIDNITYHSANFTSAILQQATTYKITITVTDSRGRTASVEKQITCIAYANPKITSATVTRCNSDGTVNQSGTYVKYTFKAEIAPINNKNTHTYRLGYKKRNDSDYTYIDIANNSYTIDKIDVILTDLTFTTNNSYDFQFVVTDYFTTTPYVASIGTGFKLMNFNKSGKAMAIGKMSEAGEDEELLEIGLPTIIREKTIIDNYIENTKKEFAIPIEIGTATGWYLALSGTMTGYDSRAFLLAIEQVHMGGIGLLYVCLRCDNTTSLYSPQFFWLANRGIESSNVELKLEGNNFYLYLKVFEPYQQYHISILNEKILGNDNYGIFEINRPTYLDYIEDPMGVNPQD